MLLFLKIIIFLYLISFGPSDTLVAQPKTQILSHNPASYQYINFQYKDPIDGISVHGTFYPYRDDYDPPVVPIWGRYEGSAEVILTRLSDMRSTRKEFRNVSFVSTDHCLNFAEYDYQNPINECVLENPLILEPISYSYIDIPIVITPEGGTTLVRGDEVILKFLPDIGIKILDYDYDNKNELILITPLGYRGGPEFMIYEIIDTKEDFQIGYELLDRIPENVEFDYGNKTMKYSYSNGAYNTFYYTHKADALDGYNLISKKHSCDFIDYSQYDAEQKKHVEEWCLINSK